MTAAMRNRRFEFDSLAFGLNTFTVAILFIPHLGTNRGGHNCTSKSDSLEFPQVPNPVQSLPHINPDYRRRNYHENDNKERLENLDRRRFYLQPEERPVQHLYRVSTDY